MAKINYPIGAPNLKDEKQMFIGGYWCPKPTEKAYRYIAESGLTHMMVNTMIGHEVEDEGYYKTPFKLARKNGIKVVMHGMDKGYQFIKQYKDVFRENADVFDGIIAFDEPYPTNFNFLSEDVEVYKEDFPDYPYYVNLLPIYADYSQLEMGDYTEYLSNYVKKVFARLLPEHKILMCDIYPLLENVKIYDKWLLNLEMLREIVDEYNSELYLYFQDQMFWNRRQPRTLNELTYQLYVSLAYGMTGVSHYPYLTPKGSKKGSAGVVDTIGRKSYVFPLAQQLNALIKRLDGVYLEFKWKAVIHQIGKNNADGKNENFDNCKNTVKNYGVLKEISAEQDTVIGCFENADGYQGFIIANFDEPLSDKTDKVTLKFDGGINKAIVYENGNPKKYDISADGLTVELNAGDGVFVVPYIEN